MPRPAPTPLTDPHGYLALAKFSRKLPRCPRTGLPVSYSDIGDPDGIPVLFVPPSGCSRWFSAPQDPLANSYQIRLITVDRPGVGAVPMVPIAERIDTSCKLIESVLEHLGVRPAHLLTTSAGIYCALRLLSAHGDVFKTGLAPPPHLYLVGPWSPPLPSSDPLAYRQILDWVPDGLLTTQDVTLPYIIPALKGAETAIGALGDATHAVAAAFGTMSTWWWAPKAGRAGPGGGGGEAGEDVVAKGAAEGEGSAEGTGSADGDGGAAVALAADGGAAPAASAAAPDPDAAPGPDPDAADEISRSRLWAPSAKYLTMDYLHAEESRGIGQEHMLCLNRGGAGTGPEWYVAELSAVAAAVRAAQAGGARARLQVDVWWGGMDAMVPRKGQEWLNKTLAQHSREIALAVHNVDDGDHSDLLLRAAGIGEVYGMIVRQGDTTDTTG